MTLSIKKVIDHRTSLSFYMPQQDIKKAVMLLPGAGCSIGCCCSSCGALTQEK